MSGCLGPDDLESGLSKFLEIRSIPKTEGMLVGFSGGPDSTALLAALRSLGAGSFRAIHVDHGIRPLQERLAELDSVRAFCGNRGIALTVGHVRPGAIQARATRTGEGIEAAARRYRYAIFRRILAREGANYILLAHTLDDQLETILMRMIGGSGCAGLRGMAAIKGAVVRPFLDVPKKTILAYLECRGLPFSIDSSNATDDYLRNRLRHHLVPVLDSRFPFWRNGLRASAEAIAHEAAALSEWSHHLAFSWDEKGRLSSPAKALFEAPEAIATRVPIEALGMLRGHPVEKDVRIPARFAMRALAVLRSGRHYRGGGCDFSMDGDKVVMAPALDFPSYGGYFIVIDRPGPEGNAVGTGRVRVETRWVEGPGSVGIREDAFRFPLVVRSRRPGDSLLLRQGRKPLDELLSEMGIRKELRGIVPLVEDRSGIVAVLGADFGGRDRFRHNDSIAGPGRRLLIALKGAVF